MHAHSYTLLSREDIEYAASSAPSLFMNEKQLRLEDRAMAARMGFIENDDQPVLDAEEIRRKLGLRTSLIKSWLEGIHEPYLLDAVYDVAMGMDLPASKLQILKEYMPDKEFIGQDERAE